MVMLFKKGDPALCSNYRPISLLAIGYKILASILLQRLKSAGAENRIWHTQYGFKSNASIIDVLFITRQILDTIWAEKDSQIIFATLDWSKAFDSIAPQCLRNALLRFGLPEKFVNMVSSIYHRRRFCVSDFGY